MGFFLGVLVWGSYTIATLRLGKLFKGKITFWGEIDRQHLLPEGSQQDVATAVKKVYKNLYSDGGIIAQLEFGPGAKPENVKTVFETWQSLSQEVVT